MLGLNLKLIFDRAFPADRFLAGSTEGAAVHIALEGQKSQLANKRRESVVYYNQQIKNIRAFFKDKNFTVAAAAFEYLLDLKKIKCAKMVISQIMRTRLIRFYR